MSIKINVAVYRGDQRFDSAPCRPARLMSNGIVGAVYSGLVYPVYKFGDDDFRIDLKDQGIDKDSVPDFWPSDSELIFTPAKKSEILSLDWYVESNFYGHYLVFDGDEALLNQVLKCLVKNGVGVKRHGESIRRADDGHRYDWFVRLGSDDDRDAVIQRISEALRGVGQGESDDLKESDIPLTSQMKQEAILSGVDIADPVEIIPWVAGVINHERESQKKALSKCREKDQEIADLANRYKVISYKYLSEKRKFKQQIEILSSEISAVKNQVKTIRKKNKTDAANNHKIDELVIENSRLCKQLECIKEESAYFVAEHDIISKELEDQSCYIDDLEKSKVELTNTVHKLERNQNLPRRSSLRVQWLVEERLGTFKRLIFAEGTAEVLAAEFDKLDAVYNVLTRLDNKENIPANVLTTIASGWKEVKEHIHTGRNHGGSDMGRIYYRIDKVDKKKLYVVVHHKRDDKEQRRFFEKLAKS